MKKTLGESLASFSLDGQRILLFSKEYVGLPPKLA